MIDVVDEGLGGFDGSGEILGRPVVVLHWSLIEEGNCIIILLTVILILY